MKKIIFLFVIHLAVFSHNSAFSQDTTVQDAVDFIKTNLNQSSKITNATVNNSFYDIFVPDRSYDVNYYFNGQIADTVISADYCTVTILETTTDKTRITLTVDNESPEESPIYSIFEYLKQDTIIIDFSKISKIESDKSSITFSTFNNMDLIKHKAQITQTPSKKRKNDLVSYFKVEEDDLYRKLKRFLTKNNINYETYPDKVEHNDYSANKFTIGNIEKEKCARLLKAFSFLQKKCGVPKEKF